MRRAPARPRRAGCGRVSRLRRSRAGGFTGRAPSRRQRSPRGISSPRLSRTPREISPLRSSAWRGAENWTRSRFRCAGRGRRVRSRWTVPSHRGPGFPSSPRGTRIRRRFPPGGLRRRRSRLRKGPSDCHRCFGFHEWFPPELPHSRAVPVSRVLPSGRRTGRASRRAIPARPGPAAGRKNGLTSSHQ